MKRKTSLQLPSTRQGQFAFNSKVVRSHLSKLFAFLSLQMHCIKQWGMALYISQLQWHPKLPCQQARSLTTFLSITHSTPNSLKINPHNSLPRGQCNIKWSTVSSSLLHIQHQHTKIMLRFLRFSKFSTVRIFPKVVTQRKKSTLLRTSGFQILFHGKLSPPVRANTL